MMRIPFHRRRSLMGVPETHTTMEDVSYLLVEIPRHSRKQLAGQGEPWDSEVATFNLGLELQELKDLVGAKLPNGRLLGGQVTLDELEKGEFELEKVRYEVIRMRVTQIARLPRWRDKKPEEIESGAGATLFKGIGTYQGKGEKTCEVRLFPFAGEGSRFARNMLEIGEELALRLAQKEVYLRIQQGGKDTTRSLTQGGCRPPSPSWTLRSSG